MEKLKKLGQFYNKYERYLIPGALIFGFITDVITFRFINFPLAMSLLFGHLIVIGSAISVLNLYKTRVSPGKFFSYAYLLSPLALQYSFGVLFSAFLIFYSHSGSIAASWPFILKLIFLMIANEVFRKYNVRPEIHVSVYFFAIFSYTNLILPHIFKDLSVFVFLSSGALSLLLIHLFLQILSSRSLSIREKRKEYGFGIIGIFALMNIFYFTNLIPPIPLTLRDIGVYHGVERVNDNYRVIAEEECAWHECLFSHEEIHVTDSSKTVYVYSSVFAPRGIDLEMIHEWKYYNEENKKWETVSKIPFFIAGGRDIGYRWYTYRTVWPGVWRVNIKTEIGQTVARKTFRVVKSKSFPEVEEKIK